jgi:hypothetical protein
LAHDGANRHDSKLLAATLDSIPIERPEPTREQPQGLCLDRGYDYDSVRNLVAERRFTPHIRARGEEIKLKLQTPGWRARRWIVEACHSWLNRHRALLIRWSKKDDNHLALLQLASGLIAFKKARLATQPGWALSVPARPRRIFDILPRSLAFLERAWPKLLVRTVGQRTLSTRGALPPTVEGFAFCPARKCLLSAEKRVDTAGRGSACARPGRSSSAGPAENMVPRTVAADPSPVLAELDRVGASSGKAGAADYITATEDTDAVRLVGPPREHPRRYWKGPTRRLLGGLKPQGSPARSLNFSFGSCAPA